MVTKELTEYQLSLIKQFETDNYVLVKIEPTSNNTYVACFKDNERNKTFEREVAFVTNNIISEVN